MDWVETTGKSVEEATDRALTHLGVSRSDAEIEVLEEPQKGLFGRVKGEARVRARIRPTGPRPKRSRRSSSKESGRGERRPKEKGDGASKSKDGQREQKPSSEKKPKEGARKGQPKTSQSSEGKKSSKGQGQTDGSGLKKKEEAMAESISLAEQGEIAREFVAGLLSTMGITAEVGVREIDEETVEISVDANPPTELGVLVGPRGSTLQALQEVTRTVVQAKSAGRTDRILVDVAKYRERRVAALGRFANQVADEVTETGEERALEPMSPADRKAVHDALVEREGVVTRSEGEEPRRFVVISPA